MMDGHDGDVAVPPSSDVSCSICLDLISHTGDRSRAKLQCGHEFHLDCIGSAFNMKGAMQCPNCRKVEKGQWLYANSSAASLPELSIEDWFLDDDDYDTVYSEMPVRDQLCPFGEITRVGSSSESSSRGGSLLVSSVLPRNAGNDIHARDRMASLSFYSQQHRLNQQHLDRPAPLVPGTRSGSGPIGQADQSGGFYSHPPSRETGWGSYFYL